MLSIQVVEMARAAVTTLGAAAAGSIVVMTKAFGAEMAREMCADAGEYGAEPEEIAGVPVVYKAEAETPELITADGRRYNLLPDWAREGRLLNQEQGRILLPS